MLPSDCLRKLSADGVTPILIVQTPSGRRFRVIEPMRSGGVGRVYLVTGLGDDGKLRRFALKEYPRPEDDEMRRQQADIRANLNGLIRDPILDEDGAPLKMMVAPIEIVDFPRSGTFGYVMDYVDLDDYVCLSELLNDYPGADVICRIGRQLSHFFDRLASSAGKCYKDVNEDNIYIHRITGDIRIIDNDNVGDPAARTIAGTPFYMAPEVQSGERLPDRLTDRFSMAVFLLRLLTGAYPFDGRRTLEMMRQRGVTVHEIAPEAFGRDAVFIFDPQDDSNSIRGGAPDPDAGDEALRLAEAWRAQCALWDMLPDALRDAFVQTFCSRDRGQRTTARQWYDLFCRLEDQLIRCDDCGRMIFGSSGECPDCGAPIVTVRCDVCGRTTPAAARACIHCGHVPGEASGLTEACPHCRTLNLRGARICRSCGRHILVECAKCGQLQPGDASTCSCCGTPLYRACPICGRPTPLRSRSCAHCGSRFDAQPRRCDVCGRTALPGQIHCIQCGSLLQSPHCARTLSLELDLKLPSGVTHVHLSHEFPAGEDSCCYADSLHPSLPHEPLFTLLYHRAGDRVALQNRTGQNLDCYSRFGGQASVLPPDGRMLLSPGDVIRFSAALQLRVQAMN